MDLGGRNVAEARRAVVGAALTGRVAFCSGDADALPFADGIFDVVISECVVSTFSNKAVVLREMRRVPGPRGKLGITDVTLQGALPEELHGVAA